MELHRVYRYSVRPVLWVELDWQGYHVNKYLGFVRCVHCRTPGDSQKFGEETHRTMCPEVPEGYKGTESLPDRGKALLQVPFRRPGDTSMQAKVQPDWGR